MGFRIISADITTLQVDAIVNTTDRFFSGGGGVDHLIYEKAGEQLYKALGKFGKLHLGDAKVTEGFNLPCKYIIHTSGPHWTGRTRLEIDVLGACYRSCIEKARVLACKTIAFPLICSKGKRFPKELALTVAMDAIKECLDERDDIDVILTVYNGDQKHETPQDVLDGIVAELMSMYQSSEEYLNKIAHIWPDPYDRNTARRLDREKLVECCGMSEEEFDLGRIENRGDRQCGNARIDLDDVITDDYNSISLIKSTKASHRIAQEPSLVSDDVIDELFEKLGENPTRKIVDMIPLDESFQDTLARYVTASGLKIHEIYDAMGMSKQGFYKILKGDVNPNRLTVFALVFVFKLNSEQMVDFLMKAGYAINRSSLEDMLIASFVKKGNYDRYELDKLVFDLDLMPLPGSLEGDETA